jgi:hypothetical protein
MLSGSGASALAQDASTRGSDEVPQSRISPVKPGLVRMPVVTMPAKPDTRPISEQIGKPVSPAQFVEAARLCIAVASSDNVVSSHILARSGWSYTQPRKQSNNLGSFESIQFSKDGQSIVLLDFGSRVMCRVVGRVEELSQLGEVRKALIDGLAATSIGELSKFEQLAANIQRNAPEADLSNVLVAGNHMLELAATEKSIALQSGEADTPFRVVMVSSVPLPKEFQSQAPTGATN